MLKYVFQPCYVLDQTRRIGSAAPSSDRMTLAELAILVTAGVAAATAVAAIPLQIHIPGHAILKAALPIVAGMALAPRRMAGSIMAISAALAVLLFSAIHFGQLQSAAVVALLAIGPAIDIALAYRVSSGWQMYLRFALAGLLANTLAFFTRGGVSMLGLDRFRLHALAKIDGRVFLSFAACGAIAGLLSAAVCFRSSVKERSAMGARR